MPEEKSSLERWNDYLASKNDDTPSYSYRRSPSRGRTTYYSYSPTTRAYSPPRTSTYSYTSRAYSPPRTSTYTSRAYSAPRASSYTSYTRTYSPPRTSSYSRAYSPPRTSTYTSRAYSPPRTSYYTSTTRARFPSRTRAYSPPRTSYYTSTTRARSPSLTRTYTYTRGRSPSRTRSRLSSIRKSLSSALSSVPKETLHDFGDAVGSYMADRLGWSELDGRTTDQRAGKDKWSGTEKYYGYSTMG
jgi:hypothetical protein